MFLIENKNLILFRIAIISLIIFFLSAVPAIAQDAPGFNFLDVNSASDSYGSNIRLSDFQGRLTVLFFFSTTDENSIAVSSRVEQDLYQKYDSACTAFLGMAGWGNESDAVIDAFCQTNNFTFPVLHSDLMNWLVYNQALSRDFSPPYFVIIDNFYKIL